VQCSWCQRTWRRKAEESKDRPHIHSEKRYLHFHLMGDYGFGSNSNVRALSPVDFNKLTNNQSLFSPEPHTMQDETLLEKPAVKPQQMSPNPETNGDQSLDDSLIRKPKSDGQNETQEEKINANDSVNQVANSLGQLGLSEQSAVNVISSAINTPSFSSDSNFWSLATADDTFLQGFPAMNGAVTFQSNFAAPAPNALFNANVAPQLGMNMHHGGQNQRRAITGQHNYIPQRHQPNIFLNNTKTYPTWSSAPTQSAWPQPSQAPMNPWGNMQQQQQQQRRSVPNMNPVGAPQNKKSHPNGQAFPSSLISPSKFRRSTSFPGQMQHTGLGNKHNLDCPSIAEDHRDGNPMPSMQQMHHQVRLLARKNIHKVLVPHREKKWSFSVLNKYCT
jgi:hypothetical protein